MLGLGENAEFGKSIYGDILKQGSHTNKQHGWFTNFHRSLEQLHFERSHPDTFNKGFINFIKGKLTGCPFQYFYFKTIV